MVSIIICSRKSDISPDLRANIEDSIGCTHDYIIIDNSDHSRSIFQAYNEGVRRATGEILCFCHDDILFKNSNWGPAIIDIFKDETIGQVGIAGTHFLPNVPLYWWSSPFISQFNLENDHGRVKKNDTRDNFNGHLAEVVAVDGVCFFIPRKLFETIHFDDLTFDGFHAYDMDISMQVQALGKKVCVTDVLTIEHFWSEDSFLNKKYMAKLNANMNLFYQKWKDYLPIVRGLNEPQIVIDRLNNLCIQAYEATRIRESKAYRLGRLLLKPIKSLRRK